MPKRYVSEEIPKLGMFNIKIKNVPGIRLSCINQAQLHAVVRLRAIVPCKTFGLLNDKKMMEEGVPIIQFRNE